MVLPAAGVAEARNESPSWARTASTAACCQARSGPAGRPRGQRATAPGGGVGDRRRQGRRRLGDAADGTESRDVGDHREVTHFSDPGCPWAWSAGPAFAMLHWRYGDQLALAAPDDRPQRDRASSTSAAATPASAGARLPLLPPPRDAVRDRPARAPHGTWPMCRVVVADAPARARARVVGVPRAPVRAVHEHARARRAGRASRQALAWLPGIDAAALVAAAAEPETEELFAADRALARTAAGGRPSSRAARPPRPTARSASPPRASCSRRPTAAASRSAASSRSRPTTSRSPTSTASLERREPADDVDGGARRCSRTGSPPPRSRP